jgi:hypothetical protein
MMTKQGSIAQAHPNWMNFFVLTKEILLGYQLRPAGKNVEEQMNYPPFPQYSISRDTRCNKIDLSLLGELSFIRARQNSSLAASVGRVWSNKTSSTGGVPCRLNISRIPLWLWCALPDFAGLYLDFFGIEYSTVLDPSNRNENDFPRRQQVLQ